PTCCWRRSARYSWRCRCGAWKRPRRRSGTASRSPPSQPRKRATARGAPAMLEQRLSSAALRLAAASLSACQHPAPATMPGMDAPWIADRGDGTYQNPVLHADYADPDVIRVGDTYYMT